MTPLVMDDFIKNRSARPKGSNYLGEAAEALRALPGARGAGDGVVVHRVVARVFRAPDRLHLRDLLGGVRPLDPRVAPDRYTDDVLSFVGEVD